MTLDELKVLLSTLPEQRDETRTSQSLRRYQTVPNTCGKPGVYHTTNIYPDQIKEIVVMHRMTEDAFLEDVLRQINHCGYCSLLKANGLN